MRCRDLLPPHPGDAAADWWSLRVARPRFDVRALIHDPPLSRQSSAYEVSQSTVGRERGEKTLTELAQLHDVHPNQITAWKAQLVEAAAGVFGSGSTGKEAAPAVDLKALHAKIGELTVENDFLAGALGKAGLLSAKR